MKLRQLYPHSPVEIDLEAQLDVVRELYRPIDSHWLRLNFVASIDGVIADSNGISDGLSSRTDRRILGSIRANSDVVLIGAASVRAEGYFLPRDTALAIVTGSGDLSGHRIPTGISREKIIVFCPDESSLKLTETFGEVPFRRQTLPGPRMNLKLIVDRLRDLGYSSIVCEGGSQLAGELLESDLVDEICLTISPTLVGAGPSLLSSLESTHDLKLRQIILDEDSFLYGSWLVAN